MVGSISSSRPRKISSTRPPPTPLPSRRRTRRTRSESLRRSPKPPAGDSSRTTSRSGTAITPGKVAPSPDSPPTWGASIVRHPARTRSMSTGYATSPPSWARATTAWRSCAPWSVLSSLPVPPRETRCPRSCFRPRARLSPKAAPAGSKCLLTRIDPGPAGPAEVGRCRDPCVLAAGPRSVPPFRRPPILALSLVDMEDDLAALLAEQQVSCQIWPEQTEGPYHRDAPPERRDITEDRVGLPLRVGLRLVDASTGDRLSGSTVEVWQADHEGRYSGFLPFHARPGQVVTSASVPREIVAPAETFLRGRQRADSDGMCAFDTIYPGWYSSRTVHIHLAVTASDHRFVSQLYFPDELTDQVYG